MFLGYSETSKAYRVSDLDDNCIVTTRSVVLDERPPAAHRDVVYVRDASFSVASNDLDGDDDAVHASAAPSVPPTETPPADDIVIDEDMEVDMDGIASTQPVDGVAMVPRAGGGGGDMVRPVVNRPNAPRRSISAPLLRQSSLWLLHEFRVYLQAAFPVLQPASLCQLYEYRVHDSKF